MEKYILAYLKGFYENPKKNRILDYFKTDLDFYLYGYGRQFSTNNDKESQLFCVYEKSACKKLIYSLKRNLERDWNKGILYTRSVARKLFKPKINIKRFANKVLFVESVSKELVDIFADNEIEVVCLPDYLKHTKSGLRNLMGWYNSLNNLSFRERLQVERYECLDEYILTIQEEFKDYIGLFAGNDEYFICKLFIDAFKGMGVPTFNWMHGIPGLYHPDIYRRADYLMVWGQGIKENFIKSGMDANRIIVAGNIRYLQIPEYSEFKHTLDNVLVMTSVTIGHTTHTWKYDSFSQWDRSLLITYIYSVEKVLKSIGVKKARLRPHPINNYDWLSKFIDTDFYEMDKKNLNDSLEEASLLIGPTSSTIVETMRKGVTYLVYEPCSNGKNINNADLYPPYDGSDSSLKVAFNEDELKELIVSQYSPDPELLKKYMIPFSFDSIKEYLRKR